MSAITKWFKNFNYKRFMKNVKSKMRQFFGTSSPMLPGPVQSPSNQNTQPDTSAISSVLKSQAGQNGAQRNVQTDKPQPRHESYHDLEWTLNIIANEKPIEKAITNTVDYNHYLRTGLTLKEMHLISREHLISLLEADHDRNEIAHNTTMMQEDIEHIKQITRSDSRFFTDNNGSIGVVDRKTVLNALALIKRTMTHSHTASIPRVEK